MESDLLVRSKTSTASLIRISLIRQKSHNRGFFNVIPHRRCIGDRAGFGETHPGKFAKLSRCNAVIRFSEPSATPGSLASLNSYGTRHENIARKNVADSVDNKTDTRPCHVGRSSSEIGEVSP